MSLTDRREDLLIAVSLTEFLIGISVNIQKFSQGKQPTGKTARREKL